MKACPPLTLDGTGSQFPVASTAEHPYRMEGPVRTPIQQTRPAASLQRKRNHRRRLVQADCESRAVASSVSALQARAIVGSAAKWAGAGGCHRCRRFRPCRKLESRGWSASKARASMRRRTVSGMPRAKLQGPRSSRFRGWHLSEVRGPPRLRHKPERSCNALGLRAGENENPPSGTGRRAAPPARAWQ